MIKTALIFIILSITSIYADEIVNGINIDNNQSEDKLQSIQNKIDKYTKMINDMPLAIDKNIGNLERLKDIGAKVQTIVARYLLSIDECSSGMNSKEGKVACEDIQNLNIGEEIRLKTQIIVDAIAKAEKELDDIYQKEADIPKIKKVIESLNDAKSILMQEI